MENRSWVFTGLVILLASGCWIVVEPGAVGSATSVPAASDSQTAAGADLTVAEAGDPGLPGSTYDAVEIDAILLSVDLTTEGTADWRIEHRVRLDDPNATAGFERTRREIRQNRSAFRVPFAESVRAMATTAQAKTGRAMVVENVTVEASREHLPREYGIVAYEFRWHGFAATGDTLRAGDALSGLFLDEVTTLAIGWPEATEPVELAPDPATRRDGGAVWRGPLEFAGGEPRIVLASDARSFGSDYAAPRSNDAALALATAGAVLGSLAVAFVLRRRRRRGKSDPTREQPEGAPGTGEPAHVAEYADPENATGSSGRDSGAVDESQSAGPTEAGRAAAAESGRGTATASPAGADASGERTDPESLLSNEERVLELLEERGGRVKQQDVVAAFGWSETKTSEVVGELRAADAVSVYRLGRENVLALPDVARHRPDGPPDEATGDRE
ncbi:helix-turn-helix transcriptional regulator [Halovivax limisalsi]|uniref:helix-turn-helix transcriptional regulator n=1 Tax=Halovivax limisalsi TaxID=1453760 RepID=UPI001FFDE439|nr:hypothetical protein [Halovivax limisalsi]